MTKCIHGKVRPCYHCQIDYDRAAPYVATNWEEEANQWKDECHTVSGELEAEIALCHSIIRNGADSPDKLAYVFAIPTSTGEDWDEAVDKLMEGTRCRT